MLNNIQKALRTKLSFNAGAPGIPDVPDVPTAAAPAAQPGVGLRAGDWRSSVDTGAAPAAVAENAGTGIREATTAEQTAASAGKATGLRMLGNVAGVGSGVYGATQAAGDISRNGLNVDNGTNLAGSTALAGGSAASLAGVVNPVGVGAGAFLAGKTAGEHLPEGIQRGLARTVSALAHPVDATQRVFNGGNFLPEDPTDRPPLANMGAINEVAKQFPDGAAATSLRTMPVAAAGQRAPVTTPTQTAPAAVAPTAPVAAAPAPNIGTDGMATDAGGNPLPGYGSITVNGKKTMLNPGSTGAESGLRAPVTDSMRAAYAPTQYSSRTGTKALDDQTASVQALDRGTPSFLDELRGNVNSRRGLRAREIDNNFASNMRGHDIAEENSANSLRGSMLNHAASLAMTQAQLRTAQMNHDDLLRQQNITNNREQTAQDFSEKQASEKSLGEQIAQMHTTNGPDGKPVVDQVGANATRKGIDDMVAKQIMDLKASGSPEDMKRAKNLSDHGVHALSPDARAKAIAAVNLMNKVNAESSNINPFKPDPLRSTDPRDYMGLSTHPSGDFVTKTGQRIPARFLNKQNSDYFGGQPTDTYDILKAR